MTDEEIKEELREISDIKDPHALELDSLDKAINIVSGTLLWLYGMKLFVKIVKR